MKEKQTKRKQASKRFLRFSPHTHRLTQIHLFKLIVFYSFAFSCNFRVCFADVAVARSLRSHFPASLFIMFWSIAERATVTQSERERERPIVALEATS